MTTQLVAYVTAVCLLVLLGTSISSYRAIYSILRGEAEKYAIQQVAQAEVGIRSILHDIQKAIVILQSDPRFTSFAEKETTDPVESVQIEIDFLEAVSYMLSFYDFIDSIGVFTERGECFLIGSGYSPKGHGETGGSPFYVTGEYRRALEDTVPFMWIPGTRRSDFAPMIENDSLPSLPLISAVKGVDSQFSGRRTVIVLNIEESQFVELFAVLADQSDQDRIYVMSDTGYIVPSRITIGSTKKKAITGGFQEKSDLDVDTLTFSDEQIAIVLYRIREMGWTLVREIPLAEVSKAIRTLRRVVVLSFFLSTVAFFLFSLLWIRTAVRPIRDLARAMQEVGRGRLGTQLDKKPRNEIGSLIEHFNKMSVDILNLVAANRGIEREKRIQEIRALQAQINPHFLYNTLNTIKYMAIASGARNIADSLTLLGKNIRPVFTNEGVLHSLRDEIEFLGNYVEIFNLRYGNNIFLDTRISDDLLGTPIPKFILQPLVENSLLHGIHSSGGAGTLALEADKTGDDISITISDTGKGMTRAQVAALDQKLASDAANNDRSGGQVGLENVNRRMKLNYGEEYGIRIRSELGRGTTVHLRVPVHPPEAS